MDKAKAFSVQRYLPKEHLRGYYGHIRPHAEIQKLVDSCAAGSGHNLPRFGGAGAGLQPNAVWSKTNRGASERRLNSAVHGTRQIGARRAPPSHQANSRVVCVFCAPA